MEDPDSDGFIVAKAAIDRLLLNNYSEFNTQVLVASVRNVEHVTKAAKIGAHFSTLPAKIFKELYKHELTDKGLKSFLDDWEKTGQKILPENN